MQLGLGAKVVPRAPRGLHFAQKAALLRKKKKNGGIAAGERSISPSDGPHTGRTQP